ncbi:recombination regulator RecX [Jeotgalibaca caeni]|uniref:recombination regulator RecX n=1 Tax=Jeotgalibaca caeni TaxID=3028623 RepID=UPI00237EBC52|nr:recombination regulator RecX [Jeotgalibaca caeni]MDE1548183.1 recombination regulator RecX [Jeotgalibaca caeni]
MTENEKVPTITTIEVQKRRKDRFNIYVDGKYAFPVSEAVLIKTGLFKGMKLTKERQEEIENENNAYLAYTIAVDYLSYGLRSEKEVTQKLRENEIAVPYIEQTLQRLRDQQYINDQIYGESYTRTAANINRKGPSVIAQELKLKGLDEQTIQTALKQYPKDQQLENAQTLAEKSLRKQSRISSREALQKVRLHLQQKGYDRDIIEQALADLDHEKSEEDELQALRVQGEKVWRRYSRKAEGRELAQKVRSNLYQKGFPNELIQQYIEEKTQEMDDE